MDNAKAIMEKINAIFDSSILKILMILNLLDDNLILQAYFKSSLCLIKDDIFKALQYKY